MSPRIEDAPVFWRSLARSNGIPAPIALAPALCKCDATGYMAPNWLIIKDLLSQHYRANENILSQMRKSFSASGIASRLNAHEVEFWPYRAVEIEQESLGGRLSRGTRISQRGAETDRDTFSGATPGAVIDRSRKSEGFVGEPFGALRPVDHQLAPTSVPGYADLGENGLP